MNNINELKNRIFNEDCIDFMKKLPDECVDLIIADPPYYKVVNEKWDNQWKTEEEYLNWCRKWILECKRILKSTGNLYVWGGIGKKQNAIIKLKLLIDEIPLIFQDWITWKKQKGLGSKRGYMYIREECLFYTKSEEYTINTPYLDEIAKNHGRLNKDKINYKRCGNIWTDINEVTVGNLIHTERIKGFPTQKPIKTSKRIIQTSSNQNDLVYIPFAGSGSEIVSCIKNNRNYIATEINNEYIEDIIIPRINKID